MTAAGDRSLDRGLIPPPPEVPILGGGTRRSVYLDNAATTPPMTAVVEAVDEFMPYYSSVHRGAGWTSAVATAAFEQARAAVAAFVGARADDAVVFTANTTGATNVLAAASPPDTHVITFASEHHANLLPWRRRSVDCLAIPASAGEALGALEAALTKRTGPVLVAVTGASNVTGELWPIVEMTALAHEHQARIFVDCAQLAPHQRVDLATLGADWIGLSGHKMYAPYGVGALVGRADWLRDREPFIAGGGAVLFVTETDVAWHESADRQEAGSPNVVGAIALGVACRELARIGMDRVAAHESELVEYTDERLAAVKGLQTYQVFAPVRDRIGVFSFNLAGMDQSLVAMALSGEHGISVRAGCFCAHPLMMHLLGVSEAGADAVRTSILAGSGDQIPGAVRMSFGLGTTTDDIDAALVALARLAKHGPAWAYRYDPRTRSYEPDPDDRPLPDIAALGR